MEQGLTRYAGDFSVGERFTTLAVTIDQADITAFAGFSGDFNPIHTDEEFAKATPFGTRIAHGLAVVSKMTGRFNQLGFWDGSVIAMLSTQWAFHAPVKPGDTVYAELTVAEVSLSERGATGVVAVDFDIRNQRREQVIDGQLRLMLRQRRS